MNAGPTMRRRQLGAALQQLRKAADVSVQDAAAELDCAVSKISHIETGRNPPRKLELQALSKLYGASAEAYTTLEKLRTEANARGWWSTQKLPAWLGVYVGLEADAVTLRSFDGEVIPGLMQTEGYSRATHVAATHMVRPDEVDRLVETRRRRGLRLTSDERPLDFHAVISEAAIRRAQGLGEVGTTQLRHLLDLAQRDNVRLQILPLNMGLHASLGGSFVLLSFADEAPPAAYLEYASGGQVADEREIVDGLFAAWELQHAQALTAPESIRWLRRVLDGTDPPGEDHG
ncbi:helix-turn-helix domain-containing protein [Pseudonocardia sp. GCM10023141]|uniref:helix-turn-helix domain-containing protein n=1 Tax=Pseudonocardia sp. GCM10023141 TaxID=3252653 RepID=UPI003620FB46